MDRVWSFINTQPRWLLVTLCSIPALVLALVLAPSMGWYALWVFALVWGFLLVLLALSGPLQEYLSSPTIHALHAIREDKPPVKSNTASKESAQPVWINVELPDRVSGKEMAAFAHHLKVAVLKEFSTGELDLAHPKTVAAAGFKVRMFFCPTCATLNMAAADRGQSETCQSCDQQVVITQMWRRTRKLR